MSIGELEININRKIRVDVDKIREKGSGFEDMSDEEVLEVVAEDNEKDLEILILEEYEFFEETYGASVGFNAEINSET